MGAITVAEGGGLVGLRSVPELEVLIFVGENIEGSSKFTADLGESAIPIGDNTRSSSTRSFAAGRPNASVSYLGACSSALGCLSASAPWAGSASPLPHAFLGGDGGDHSSVSASSAAPALGGEAADSEPDELHGCTSSCALSSVARTRPRLAASVVGAHPVCGAPGDRPDPGETGSRACPTIFASARKSALDLDETQLSGGATRLSTFGSVGVGDGVLRPSLFDA